MTTSHTDTELVLQLKANDSRALSYLYDHYSGALYGFILQMRDSTGKANDILQQVFVMVWKEIRNYDPDKSSLFIWMLSIARRVSITSTTKRTSNDQHAITAGMEAKDRVLIDLAYFKGYSIDEIAVIQSILPETVKAQLRDALNRLGKYLK